MLKIGFIWEWERAKEIYPLWRDGLRAALEHIEKKHKVDWLFNEAPEKEYDWILTWCDSNSNFSYNFTKYEAKRAIILTTNPTNHHNLQGFDIIFCESSVIYDECRMRGLRAVKAFGTDEQFFTPDTKVKKDIKYFYPATFSPWKLQSDIAHLGKELLCIGTIQPDGQKEYDYCEEKGVQLKEGYFPIKEIRDYYRRAESVIIPAVHGSERTVLEAMSCDILPVVNNERNIRTKTYIDEFIVWNRKHNKGPREFILANYSGKKYADTIIKAMEDYDED